MLFKLALTFTYADHPYSSGGAQVAVGLNGEKLNLAFCGFSKLMLELKFSFIL